MKNKQEYTKQIVELAIDALDDVKGENIVVIDTQNLTPMFSNIIICTASSTTKATALANSVVGKLKEHNIHIIGTEGFEEAQWILVDTGDVVIHIMLPQVRTYYDLETLWNDEESSN